MRLLAVVLLATVLIAGCENRTSSPGEKTGKSEVVKGVEAVPTGEAEQAEQMGPAGEVAPARQAAPENKTAKEATVDARQPMEQEQSDSTTAAEKVLPAAEEKPLVIISENPVFADTGQLLEEIDRELQLLLDTLEAMDDIQAEELNF
jgi:hypothetical protein